MDCELADAVLDGLADVVIRCECGKTHGRDSIGDHKRFMCQCSETRYGGSRVSYRLGQYGWKVSKRNLSAWRAYEKRLLARIADLEVAVGG